MSSNKRKTKAQPQIMEKASRINASRGSKKTLQQRLMKESVGIFLNGLLFRNPVALGALGLFPVVGAGYSIENAAVLSLMMLVMMLPVCLLSGWLKIPVWIRPAMVLVLSGILYIPAAYLTKWLLPQAVSALGLYAILMIGNSIVLSRANDYAPTHISLAVLMDSLGCTAGFSAVLFVVAALREIWDKLVASTGGVYHAGTYPLVGFLLLGMIAALIQHANAKRVAAERKAKQ